jgi:hypothetical protein
MNNTFYVLQKYNPFIKKWEFLDSNSYETLEDAQYTRHNTPTEYKLRIVKLSLLSIIEEEPHL